MTRDAKADLHQYFDTFAIMLTAPEMARVHSYSLYQVAVIVRCAMQCNVMRYDVWYDFQADECHIMMLSCLLAEETQHLQVFQIVNNNNNINHEGASRFIL